MNPIWFKALLLQGLIAIIGFMIGVVYFRIRTIYVLVTVGLMCPVPLFLVSPGIAGAVFVGDIIGCYALFDWFFRPITVLRKTLVSQKYVYLAVTTLVTMPVFTGVIANTLGWVNPKFLLLGIARGLIYVALFRMAATNIVKIHRPTDLLIIQLFIWLMICLCGFAHYLSLVELDAWNSLRGMSEEVTRYTRGFGGGFMGLYRGAVGAFCVGMCAVAAVILPTVRYGKIFSCLFFPISFFVILNSGSRQGLFISIIAIVFGLLTYTSLSNRKNTIRSLIITILFAVIISIIFWHLFVSEDAKWYYKGRFGNYNNNVSKIFSDAKERDTRIPKAIENIFSGPLRTFFGTGIGSLQQTNLTGKAISDYVDSELVIQLQTSGVIGLGFYIILLVSLIWNLRGYKQVSRSQNQFFAAAGFVALIAGTLLTYGHFFLATTLSHQAPMNLWLWSLLGGSHGIIRYNQYKLDSSLCSE